MANAVPICLRESRFLERIIIAVCKLGGWPFTVLFSVPQGYHRPRHYIATQGKRPPSPLKGPCLSLRREMSFCRQRSCTESGWRPPEVLRSLRLIGKEGDDKISYCGRDLSERRRRCHQDMVRRTDHKHQAQGVPLTSTIQKQTNGALSLWWGWAQKKQPTG